MKLQLDFEKENDIPCYFKCWICRNVPKQFLIDINRSWIFCVKCSLTIEHSWVNSLLSGTQFEQSIINTITVKCQICKQFIFANRLKRHKRLCKSQINLFNLNNDGFSFCKYCSLNCRCNNQSININQQPEQMIESKLREFYNCQFCFQSINFFEMQHHQAICQLQKIICDICQDTLLRSKFMKHYFICTYQGVKQMCQQKQIFSLNMRILEDQKQLYYTNFNIDHLNKELVNILFQGETDGESEFESN